MVVLMALALAGCSRAAPTQPPLGTLAQIAIESRLLDAGSGLPQEGQAAPDFRYTLPVGVEQRLSDLRGKRVLLNFWATWCGPCMAEMPALEATATANRETLVILGVNRLETPAVIAAFADKIGVTFPLIANEDGDISDRYGARLLPISYFITSDGTIDAIVRGPLTHQVLAEQLGALR
jgi:thiol-disulfide isomerase/thioredoxin